MGRILSKTISLLASVLLLAPSAYAGTTLKKEAASRDAARIHATKVAPSQKPSKTLQLMPKKTAETVASSKLAKMRTGLLKAPKQRKASAQRFAGAPVNMWGTITYSNTNDLGVYNITSDGEFSFITDACQAAYGTVLDGDIYRTTVIETLYGFFYWYTIYSYDTANDWAETSVDLDDTSMISYAMDKDPVTGDIYGCFMDADGTSLNFAKVDFDNMTKTEIAPITDQWAAFSFDASGQAYAIDINGDLLKVDKATGATTFVAETGYIPKYLGGGEIDVKSNKFYWSVCDEAGYSYLLAVDLATAESNVIYEGWDEIVGLVIPATPEDGAPAAPENLSVEFPKGALSGTVKFDISALNYAGVASTGNVNYQILANGTEIASGTSSFGAHVEVPVSVPEAGTYKFVVILSNEEGNGPEAKQSLYVGNDTPVAPKVAIAYADGKFTISWDPVDTGINGGYMDLDQMTYQVVRYPDEVIIAEATTDTTLTDAVAKPDNMTVYYYTVQAMWGDYNSEVGTSNKVALGEIIPPYLETFEDASAADAYTIIDANNDNCTWGYYENASCMYARYSTVNDMDDWLISPAVKLEAGKAYYITADIAAYSSMWGNEKFELKVGSEPTAEGMTTALVQPTEIGHTDFVTYGDYFIPETSGIYYIGIHGCSDADCYYLFAKNLSIGAGIATAAPGAVTNAKATPGANGAKTVTVSFTTPTVTFAGDALSSLTKVEIARGDELVKTFDAPAVGADLSFQDSVSEDGDYSYTVTAYNNEGAGKTVSLSAFVGITYPAPVTNVKIVENEEGNVTVSWDPVTTDINGNPMDASLITYQIRDLMTEDYAIIEDNLTSYDFNYDAVDEGDQQFVYLGISAVSARGEGDITPSDMLPCGAAYSTPFFESFQDSETHYNFGIMGNANYASWSIYGSSSGIEPYDGDNGFIACGFTAFSAYSSLFSGKIDLSNTTVPELTFAVYNWYEGSENADYNNLEVEVRTIGGEWTSLRNASVYELAGSGEPAVGWYKIHTDLSAYKGKTIQIRFTATCNSYSYLLLDAISVDEALDYELIGNNISAPSSVQPNDNFNVDVTVLNDGRKAVSAADYSVELFLNGKSVASLDGVDIQSEQSATFSFPQTLNASNDATNAYYAVVNYAADLNQSNNTTKEATVKIKFPYLNAPTDVAASANDDNSINVTWTAAAPTPTGVVTESFEDGESGDTTYGDWTFVDGDGESLGAISGYEVPGISAGETTGSFFVTDITALGISGVEAHTYDKCLLSMFAYNGSTVDDWAITPQLSGSAQTVSFWACSGSSNYPESIELLYSTTTNDTEAFISIAKYADISSDWTEYTADLPQGAKYFAIRSYATDAFFLLIDDVTYTTGDGEDINPIGYNVYRNGEKITDTPIQGTSFVDNPGVGVYEYHVSAVYEDRGESKAAGPAKVDTTSVGKVNGKLSVTAENRVIIISNAADARVELSSLDGKLIYVGKGDAKVPVNNGVYIVKIGKAITKLMVK